MEADTGAEIFYAVSHVLIWIRKNDRGLNRQKWEPLFFGGDHDILFSNVPLWDIAIKRGLGKMTLEGDLADFSQRLESRHGFRRLGIEVPDLCRLEKYVERRLVPPLWSPCSSRRRP